MTIAIHVPRINNNDDQVKLVGIEVAVGATIRKGQVIAQVETDKAVVDVESGVDGFLLALMAKVDEVVAVGSVLAWVGSSRDEPIPLAANGDGDTGNAKAASSAPTAKARALLLEHGIGASLVQASGDRLSVADIERYLATQGQTKKPPPNASPTLSEALPELAGELKPLKSEERGMLATVLWHRDVAVPGYIEISYDPSAWKTHAQNFGKTHALLLNPLMPLMAWRLVQLAAENPLLNAAIAGNARYEYQEVNLGMTIQVSDVLYLAVVRNAATLGAIGFVNAMVELQRRAAAHKLRALETQGTTIGFSSMERWHVSRHIPILSPRTSIMIAHTVSESDVAVLGATYDHRVLNGAVVANTLRKLSRPGDDR